MLDSFDEGSRVGVVSATAGKPEVKQSHNKPAMLTRRASIDDLEYETCLLAPKVDGRIIQLNSRVIFI